jgi:phosphatidylinositol glycan class B
MRVEVDGKFPVSTETVILLSALVVYLICAVFSSGALHPDEHFQILEFAKWKLGEGSPQAMAWEHVAKIRPALQPVLAMVMIRFCQWIGMENPFHQAMVIRIITAMIMLFSMCQLIKASGSWVNPQHRNALLAATLFFWVVPMISVHFSSETLSTACLLLLLAGLLRREQPSVREALWMGIVAAIGFEFRYQMAFALVGILAWILVV